MPYSQRKFNQLIRARQNPIYGINRDASEYRTPSFCVFFKNPDYPIDPQQGRGFCFDDNFNNEGSASDSRIPFFRNIHTNFKYRRVFKLPETFHEIITKATVVNYKRVNVGPKTKEDEFYKAPWLGIPIDTSVTNPSTTVTIPISNIWKELRRSTIPNELIHLELFSPAMVGLTNTEVTASWNNNPSPPNGNSSEKIFDFTFNPAGPEDTTKIPGNYNQGTHQNNVLTDSVSITFTGAGINEDIPRKLYIIKRNKTNSLDPENDQIVGSLSIRPMPIRQHFLWFINVNSTNQTFNPLSVTQIPQALDNNQNPLSTIAARHLLDYGIRLTPIEMQNPQVRYSDGVNNSSNNLFIGGMNTPYNDNILNNTPWIPPGTPPGPVPNLDTIIQNRISSVFHSLFSFQVNGITAVPPNIPNPPGVLVFTPNTASVPVLTDINGNNIPKNQLSIIYLCHGNFLNNPPYELGRGSTISLGSPFTLPLPGDPPPTYHNGSVPDRDYFYEENSSNIFLNNINLKKYQNVGEAAPRFITLFDREIAPSAPITYNDLSIISNAIGAQKSVYKEATLIHELMHNFRLPHVFFEDDHESISQFRRNIIFNLIGTISSNTHIFYREYRRDKVRMRVANVSDISFRHPTSPINQITQTAALNNINTATSNPIENDFPTNLDFNNIASALLTINNLKGSSLTELDFNHIDLLTFDGYNALISILQAGQGTLLQGYIDDNTLGFGNLYNGSPSDLIWDYLLILFLKISNYKVLGLSPNIHDFTFPNKTRGDKDPVASNIMDYNFSDSNPLIAQGTGGATGVQTDRKYLMHCQWEVIRRAI